nr:hypothetical protein [Kocuria rhizophila]
MSESEQHGSHDRPDRGRNGGGRDGWRARDDRGGPRRDSYRREGRGGDDRRDGYRSSSRDGFDGDAGGARGGSDRGYRGRDGQGHGGRRDDRGVRDDRYSNRDSSRGGADRRGDRPGGGRDDRRGSGYAGRDGDRRRTDRDGYRDGGRRDDRSGDRREDRRDERRRDDRGGFSRGGDARRSGGHGSRDDRFGRDARPYSRRGDDRRDDRRDDRSNNRGPREQSRGGGFQRPGGDRFEDRGARGGRDAPGTGERRDRSSDRRGSDRPDRRHERGGHDRGGHRSEPRGTYDRDERRGGHEDSRPRFVAPEIDADVTGRELDRSMHHELKALEPSNAERVSQHLVMAARYIDDDPEFALEHANAAVRKAGRIGVVREAAGVAAYAAGDYALALKELRTHRRISGSQQHLPLMVDAQRALGRADKAMEEATSAAAADLDAEAKAELAMVVSGIHADAGDHDAALAALEIPQLDKNRGFVYSPKLFRAYAEALRAVGRDRESMSWERQAIVAEAALGMGQFSEPEIVDLGDDLDEEEARRTVREAQQRHSAPQPPAGEGPDTEGTDAASSASERSAAEEPTSEDRGANDRSVENRSAGDLSANDSGADTTPPEGPAVEARMSVDPEWESASAAAARGGEASTVETAAPHVARAPGDADASTGSAGGPASQHAASEEPAANVATHDDASHAAVTEGEAPAAQETSVSRSVETPERSPESEVHPSEASEDTTNGSIPQHRAD